MDDVLKFCTSLFSNHMAIDQLLGLICVIALIAVIPLVISRSSAESFAIREVAKNSKAEIDANRVVTMTSASDVIKPITDLVKALTAAPAALSLIALGLALVWRPAVAPDATCKVVIENKAKAKGQKGTTAVGAPSSDATKPELPSKTTTTTTTKTTTTTTPPSRPEAP